MGEQAAYATDDQRWHAVRERDAHADGHFYYGVRSTGVYSRPSCVARAARRENTVFFATVAEARANGYRVCRRCRPDEPGTNEQYATAVLTACRLMEESVEAPSLDDLARAVGFSRFHFHRVFKAFTGVTPHAYFSAGRTGRVRRELSRADTVSDAIYSSGFNSSGHFYAQSAEMLGMTPTAFRYGGSGGLVSVVVGESSLGPVLVAVADKGVCAVLVGQDGGDLRRQLAVLLPSADQVDPAPAVVDLVTDALDRAAPPELGRTRLPADVLGVALQLRVRQALRDVPAVTAGTTALDRYADRVTG